MLTEIAVVEDIVAGLSGEVFAQDQQALRAVLYSLAVIGEAMASTIEELEAAAPAVPWHQLRGMRNMVIHEYFRVDEETIWQMTQVHFTLADSPSR